MFSFFDFLFNGISGIFNFIIDTFSGLFRMITLIDDLSGTIMNAINSLPDVFGNYALISIALIAGLGIVRLFTGGG